MPALAAAAQRQQEASVDRMGGGARTTAAEALAPLKLPDAQALCAGDFLRLWPHLHGTDGFFAAVWQRA